VKARTATTMISTSSASATKPDVCMTA
jgi:hypothetical protein